MSRSPERISSYRRHFEGALAACSSSSTALQVRVSSPSPTRRSVRTRSASYSRSGSMGRRAVSASRRMAGMGGVVGMGALCVGMGGVDLDAAAAENQAFKSTRTSERQEMITLNDRLAVYIEKVRSLESQNKLLEAEIDAIQNRYTKPSGLRKLYEEQLREMMRVAEQMKMQRDLAFAAKNAMAGELEMMKAKYEEAVEARKKVEMDIEAFRPDVDAATAARIALEKQLDNLERELEFLQRLHKQEIEELMAQIYGGISKVEVAYALPDLSSALKDIQSQYDSIAAKNLQEMDSWYKNKFQDMNHVSTRHVDRSRSARQEMTGVKRDIANKERDLEALKTRNEALEAQIREARERYSKEEEDLRARMEAVKLELQGIKAKIAMMMKEYQDLLNAKMALEIEITTYRKLIEGEDLRLGTMVRFGGMSLMGSGMGGGIAAMGAGMSAGSAKGMGAMSGSAMSASGKSAGMGTDMTGGIAMASGKSSSLSATETSGSVSASACGFSTSGSASAVSGSMEMESKTMSSSNDMSTMVGGVAMASGMSSTMSASKTSGSMETESKTMSSMMSSSNGMSSMMSSSNGMSKTVSSTNEAMSMSSSSKSEFSKEMTEKKTLLISNQPQGVIMSRSPERISSYRRHFEGALAASSSSTALQVRVSSPSPTRRSVRTRSASYGRSGSMGRRAMSASRRMAGMGGVVGMSALCVGMGGVDLDAASAENQAFKSTRASERQEMITLNDRLAVYIEKVRSLESQNKLLEVEIDAIQNRYTKPSGLRKLYEEQLREMMRVAEQMKMQRDLAFAAKNAMAGELEMMRAKYEEALEARKKVEMDIEAFRPDVDAATAARIALEKQLDNLEHELEFLQRLHKQEIEELMAQIYGGMSKVEVAFGLPDLGAALKDIQSQYDSIAAKNLQEMDSWYKNKFQDMTQKSTRHVDRSRSARQEITGVKRDIANKERDLEALKTRNEALEAQILEARERYKKDEEDLLARIEAVKLELQGIKSKIAMIMKEYQDLLNVKMALEIEITTYRKLIEGEDLRLNTMVRGMSLMGSGMSGGMAAMGAGGKSISGSGMSAGGVMNGSAMAMGTMSASGKSGSASAVSGSMESAMAMESKTTSSSNGMSTMVGGVAMASSMSSSMSASKSMEMESKTMSSMMSSSNGMSKTVSSTNGAMSMSSSSKTEFSEEQAVEMTERKTLLIRTVKTDEDEILSDTQERTTIICGAADDL
ncbi:uncharacterized protein LOC134097437 [Sardina pilchardus]|uniref:uncharacterized protein LOC134097437 n=1 Tax=Sardina pilchardus TaxID=27697 RepID=UPI002E0EA9B6